MHLTVPVFLWDKERCAFFLFPSFPLTLFDGWLAAISFRNIGCFSFLYITYSGSAWVYNSDGPPQAAIHTQSPKLPISTAYLVSRKYTISIPRFFSRKHCAMPSRISSLAIDSLSLSALGSVFDIKDCDVSFARIDSGALRLSLSVCV